MEDERGFTLVLGMLILLTITVVGLASFETAVFDTKIAGNNLDGIKAFWVAQTGIQNAKAKLRSSTVSQLTTNGVGLNAVGFGEGSYTVTAVGWGSNPNMITFTSVGTVHSAKSTLQSDMLKSSNPFDHAVFASSNVTFNGNNYVDSYNSSVGPWSGAGVLRNGNIGTNATANGSVLLNGSTHIYGKADIGPGGNPITPHGTVTENGVATIDGGVSALPSPKDMTPVTSPGGGTNTNLANINGSNTTVTIGPGSTTGNIIVNGSNNTVNIPSGTWNLAGFTMNGPGNKINITGNVTLIASGDFLMNGNNNITIQPGAQLTMYAAANVTLNGVSTAGGNSNPQNCVIYGTSTTAETYTFNGQSTFYGVVYAPNAAVTFNGTSDMFGSVICKTFLANGSGNIHYDQALTGAGNGVAMISWREINN